MNGLAVRISKSYTDIKSILETWKPYCNQIIAYEHNEDANRIHIHLLIIAPTLCVRSMKNKSGLQNGGNALWSFKWAKEEGFQKYITYMTKGKYEPVYTDGTKIEYTKEQLDIMKSQWIEKSKRIHIPPRHQAYIEFRDQFLELYKDAKFEEFTDTEINDMEAVIKLEAKRHCIQKRYGHWDQQAQNEIVSYTRSTLDYIMNLKYI